MAGGEKGRWGVTCLKPVTRHRHVFPLIMGTGWGWGLPWKVPHWRGLPAKGGRSWGVLLVARGSHVKPATGLGDSTRPSMVVRTCLCQLSFDKVGFLTHHLFSCYLSLIAVSIFKRARWKPHQIVSVA